MPLYLSNTYNILPELQGTPGNLLIRQLLFFILIKYVTFYRAC